MVEKNTDSQHLTQQVESHVEFPVRVGAKDIQSASKQTTTTRHHRAYLALEDHHSVSAKNLDQCSTMTTTKISSISLPKPNYNLQIGCLELGNDKFESRQWIPRFSHLAQLIEVRKTGTTSPNQISDDWRKLVYPSLVIENARPELFVRRDFISSFVDTGSIHVVTEPSNVRPSNYQIYVSGHILSIILDEKQYRRFGLVAKKVVRTPTNKKKIYRIDIDLRDARIKNNNKYQDRLVRALRRLEALGKVYFRYVATDRAKTGDCQANQSCLDFFNHVIEEYALDGFKPVPLTACSTTTTKLEKKWLNFSQVHPPLELEFIRSKLIHDEFSLEMDSDSLKRLIDIVDWLGFQLLSLDCDREEIRSIYGEENIERYDVGCSQISGLIDSEYLSSNLASIFSSCCNQEDSGNNILRVLILYGVPSSGSEITNISNVVFLQDCSLATPEVNSISVIGFSGETWP